SCSITSLLDVSDSRYVSNTSHLLLFLIALATAITHSHNQNRSAFITMAVFVVATQPLTILLYWAREGVPPMAKSVNKVILVGNLGKDPEVKYTPQGTPVAKITLATNERYKDKSGAWQDRTEWHNVVLWQRLAEIAGEYLKKGGKGYIGGRLKTHSWGD